MENLNALSLIGLFNKGMDIVISLLSLIVLARAVVSFMYMRIQKDGLGRGIYLGTLAFIEVAFLIAIIYLVPLGLAGWLGNRVSVSMFRWVVLYFSTPTLWYFLTRKQSGLGGLSSVLIVLTVLLLGWQYNHWIGVLFISLPILMIFLHSIDRLAQVVIPASSPEDRKERVQKTRAYLKYMLGIQFPFRVAGKKAVRELDERVPGDPTTDYGLPGIVWTWPHQVVGLSRGVEFTNVAGPGTIFTKLYESPVALIDLRTQLRVSTLEAVTKDGLKVPAVIFMAFAIDKDKWPRPDWPRAFASRIRYTCPNDLEPDHTQGSYPYSAGRVRSVLRNTGINMVPQDREKSEFYWDEWVIKQIERAAREVLSERSLDELWRPRNDGPGVSALDEMAKALKNLVSPRLTEAGVNLFTARIVNYEFDAESTVAKQNIETWSTYWEQQVMEAHADAEAIYREEIEKAHAFSKSVLLDAIAEAINAARNISEDLPRHVIAQYYVHALEEYIKRQPGLDVAESKKRAEEMKNFLLYTQSEDKE
jgi:hypothetical protein